MKFWLIAFPFFSALFFINIANSQEASMFRLKNHPTYFKEKSWKKKVLILEEVLLSGIDDTEMEQFGFEVDKIVSFSLKKGNESLFIKSKLLSTYLMLDQGHYKTAHNILIDLEPSLVEESDSKRLGFLHRNLGICEINLGLNSLAWSSLKSSIRYFKECNLPEEYVHSEALSASVLIQFKRYVDAEKTLRRSISFMLKLKKYKTVFRYYHILASIYSVTKNKEKEKWANQKSFDYALKSKSLTIISLAQNNLAIVKYYEGNLKNAIKLFHKALETRISTGQNKLVCESYYNIASVYEEIDVTKAIFYYMKSKKLAIKENFYSDEGDAIMALSEIYKKQEDFEKANEALSAYIDLEEKIDEFNSQDQIKNANKVNSYELESKKMKLATELARINQVKLRNQWVIGILISGYIVHSILFFRRRKKRFNSAGSEN